MKEKDEELQTKDLLNLEFLPSRLPIILTKTISSGGGGGDGIIETEVFSAPPADHWLGEDENLRLINMESTA